MIDQPIDAREYRKIILTQPLRDFHSLRPGAKASGFIRETAQALGLTPERGITVRLTGIVALNDEEFSTVAEGTGWALAFSASLVLLLLFMALRGFRPVLAGYATLAVGLVFTLWFAAVAIGSLNLISVAFVVMFIGLSIDFSIQFSVRLAQERFEADDPTAMTRTAKAMARPLLLAAIAIAGGFLSFIPTEYRGVSELGLIAGAGMAVTFALNVTLLPALLQILRPSGVAMDMGYRWADRIDRLIQRRRAIVIALWAVPAIAGATALFSLKFDFNPLHLKDSKTESVATIRDLMRDPIRAPYNIEIVANSLADAQGLAGRLSGLPEVYEVVSAERFVPDNQKEKLALIADAADLLGLSLDPLQIAPPPSADEIRSSFRRTAEQLRSVAPANEPAKQLARLLDQAAATDDAFVETLNQALISSLPGRLAQLRASLSAQPVTADTLPVEIKRDWIAESGEARLAVFADGSADDNEVMIRFVAAVRNVAPEATGPGVQILESGLAVAHAFRTASLLSMVAMAALLFAVLRRPLDVALVLTPLLVSTLATALLCRLTGLELNFANVIALPLLLGIGVAFNIYFVINWRAGILMPLGTSTARAVLFSALTTGASFGGLAASNHPGTAGMGLLLLIGLGVILATTFTLLPALLGNAPETAGPRR
jgi:hopanoid biosynthesis associated RND transporter like protein HpnN